MKQILLRVPDELHRRLAARARDDGRSVNALATELLDLGAGEDEQGRRARLRARAVAAGVAAPAEASTDSPSSSPSRAEVAETTRGWGEVADALMLDARDRL